MAATPLARPVTGWGVLLSVVLPSPSWPYALRPQHCTAPAVVSAQVWLPSAAMAATPPAKPVTVWGVVLSVVLPSPSWPKLLSPQHCTAPAVVSAQLWFSPAAMAATPLARPVTGWGVLLSVVLPSPSWPSLLRPQHCTAPALVSAQLW
ncbi:hypothetical protein ASE28_14285 [Acidovorax sp. Root219]|nr:hypothetical protein ASE28_14285 [Acidovorax sp. Root219]